MKIIMSPYLDVYDNLALEEAILKDENEKEDILFLYINKNAIILGRNQNAIAEINQKFASKNKIQIARRLSGGGAVYHDQGNINFSFITSKNKSKKYELFLKPIINFLISLGINAKFKGRNDLEVEGFKVSGNAQFIFRERMFHHGTLLFDSNLSTLTKALNVSQKKIKSKGINSIKQRVCNLKKFLPNKMSNQEFLNKLILFFENQGNLKIKINQKYLRKKDEIKKERIKWNWIFGHLLDCEVNHEQKFPGGFLQVQYNIENQKFTIIKFQGDFLSKKNVNRIEKILINKKINRKKILQIFDKITFDDYFGSLTKANVIDTIFGE